MDDETSSWEIKCIVFDCEATEMDGNVWKTYSKVLGKDSRPHYEFRTSDYLDILRRK